MTIARPTAASAAAMAREKLVEWVSSPLLHHQDKCTDQRGSQQNPDALQRPDVSSHQCRANSFDRKRRYVVGFDNKRLRLQNRPGQTTKHSDSDDSPAPIESAIFPNIATRQENRKNDQDGDGTNVDEHQRQTDKFSAQQKE